MLKGSKILIEMLLPLTNGSFIFVVDEHLERRRGEKIKAKATYRDPVAAVITLKAVWVRLREADEVVLMSTNLDLDVLHIIEGYIKRWNIEVTFRECREHLGIETQRQWSDLAIARATPFLFGMYTIITLIGHALYTEKGIIAESTAWYKKTFLTFSDLLEAVRQEIGDVVKIANWLLKTEWENNSIGLTDPFHRYTAA